MSIATEISRIQTNRNAIRAKLVELGLASNAATLDTCATAVSNIANQGAINAQVQEGETYTIPAGYHSGAGTVAGVAGGGNYSLQEKSVTPTKSQQSVTSDAGYYGLSGVTVGAIPDIYQDVSAVTAAAGNVLTGKVFVTSEGTVTTGTMPNNGAVTKTLDTATTSYTIAKGYHSGSGEVSITTETKSATPTKSAQTISATSGKVLSSVSVAAIPANFIDTTDATARAAEILDGKTAYVNTTLVEGTMPNNESVEKKLIVGDESYTIPAGYHDGTGRVYLTSYTRIITPTKTETEYSEAESGNFYQSVVVKAIPDEYQVVTNVTAQAKHVLSGYVFVDSSGNEVDGTMPHNGATGGSIDGLTTTSFTIPAGYTSGGTVSLTSDIEEALAAI